jgi:hypothetical protein
MSASQTLKSTRHKSHVARHTSHLTPHTSHPIPHTSHLTPHTSHLTPHTSNLNESGWSRPRGQRTIYHNASHTTHTKHVTRHTSHVTRHLRHAQQSIILRCKDCKRTLEVPSNQVGEHSYLRPLNPRPKLKPKPQITYMSSIPHQKKMFPL